MGDSAFGAVGRWGGGAVGQCIFNAPALQDSKGSISPKVITFSMAIFGCPSAMAIWHHEFAFAFTGRSARLTSAPPIENDLIQLLAHRFHIGISEVGVDGDDVVRVRAGLVQRVEQAIVELRLGHFTGRTGRCARAPSCGPHQTTHSSRPLSPDNGAA
jgi:hypothetical protein